MSKLWRVISDGETEQVLFETSAENVTVADTGEKLEATTVEGALNELADGVNELRRANIILVTTLKGTEIIKTFDNLDGCELTKGVIADGYIYC